MIQKIDTEGLFCVVLSDQVEPRSLLGWQLVCITSAEQTFTAYDNELPAGMTYPVQVTRVKTMQVPQYLMRKSPESAVLEAQKAKEDALALAEEARKKLAALTLEHSKTGQELATTQSQVTSFKNMYEQQSAKLKAATEALTEKTALLANLEERGALVKLTSFERLLIDEPSTEKSDI